MKIKKLKKLSLAIILLLVTNSIFSQTVDVYKNQLNHITSSDKIYLESEVDTKPKLMYGDNAMNRFLSRNFKFPKDNLPISEIVCSFIVEIDGTISDIKVLNEVPESYSKEAIRVLDKFDEPWYPALKDKQQVRCQYVFPIIINRT